MRWWNGVLFTAAGWGLAIAAQWGASGAIGLPSTAPRWLLPAIPAAAMLLFGLYLFSLVGGDSSRAICLVQAALALGVGAMPLVYAYGGAAALGLPPTAGVVGGLLSGPVVRTMAALWLVLAAGGVWRRHAARQGAVALPEPGGFWAPAAAPEPATELPPAYPPGLGATEGERG